MLALWTMLMALGQASPPAKPLSKPPPSAPAGNPLSVYRQTVIAYGDSFETTLKAAYAAHAACKAMPVAEPSAAEKDAHAAYLLAKEAVRTSLNAFASALRTFKDKGNALVGIDPEKLPPIMRKNLEEIRAQHKSCAGQFDGIMEKLRDAGESKTASMEQVPGLIAKLGDENGLRAMIKREKNSRIVNASPPKS